MSRAAQPSASQLIAVCPLWKWSSDSPGPKQTGGGSRGTSGATLAAASTATTPTSARVVAEQWSLLRVLPGSHSAQVREVADEIRCAGDQLQTVGRQAPRGQAADEVQLVGLLPVAQGQG